LKVICITNGQYAIDNSLLPDQFHGGGLPEWPGYTPESGETMVLDDSSEVKNDPDREARKTKGS